MKINSTYVIVDMKLVLRNPERILYFGGLLKTIFRQSMKTLFAQVGTDFIILSSN